MPPRLRAAARRRARRSPRAEQFALLGSPHRDRLVDHLRARVPRLVGGVSSLLPPPLARRRRLRRHPPRGPRRVACRRPLLRRHRRFAVTQNRRPHPRRRLAPRPPSALTSRPISCAPSASCSSPPQSLCLTARTAWSPSRFSTLPLPPSPPGRLPPASGRTIAMPPAWRASRYWRPSRSHPCAGLWTPNPTVPNGPCTYLSMAATRMRRF
jgi:hypothetical protein